MSAKNCIPNRLKFELVYSDRSMIDGTVQCSDEQGLSIMRVLFPCEGRDQGLEKAFAATPSAPQGESK